MVAHHKEGVIVLLRRDDSAAEILERLEESGRKRRSAARPWDPRLHGIGAQILKDLNVGKMRVLARPKRIPSMSGFGLEVVEYVSPDDAGGHEGGMKHTGQPQLHGQGLHIGIVWSRFNEEIVRELLTACDKQLVELGVGASDIDVVSVPGALEIPLALQAMALERRGFAARPLRRAGRPGRRRSRARPITSRWSPTKARGAYLDVQLETGVPVANGVLTSNTEEQARARAPR